MKVPLDIRTDHECRCKTPDPQDVTAAGVPGQVCMNAGCYRLMGHPIHRCTSCGRTIWPNEAEHQIPMRRRVGPSGFQPKFRYQHVSWEGCQAAMTRTRVRLPQFPRKSGPHRAEAERKLMGG